MILEEKYDAIREEGLEEGRKEGLEEGRKKGLEEGRKEGHAAGIQEGIRNTIRILRELNLSEEDIIARLLETYPDSEEVIKQNIS